MPHYIAFIDGKPGAYGASIPDAPGCTAMGATTDETITNAVEALREWMADRVAEGLEPPVARSYDQVLNDAASGADEAIAMTEIRTMAAAQIPLLLDQGRSVRANISFDAGLLQAIDAAAAKRGVTRSAFLASAAREKIAAEG